MHRYLRRPAAALATLTLLAGIAGTERAKAADLTAGANIGNVPWEFQDASGEVQGFEIELVREIAKRLGKTVAIENIPFQGLFAAVQSGRIDMAVSSITITEKRLGSVSFAQPYYDSDQSLTVRADSGISGLSGLAGKIVGVDTGSTGDIWATAHQAELKLGEIRRYEGLNSAMLDLSGGRLDGYISDIPALLYYTKDKPSLKVVERIPTGEKYSIMFAKDSPLTAQVNDAITTLKKEGFLAQLHTKWFGSEPDPDTTTVQVAEIPATH